MKEQKFSKRWARGERCASDADSAEQQTDTNSKDVVLLAPSPTRPTYAWSVENVTTGSDKIPEKPSKQDGLSHDSKLMLEAIARWEAKRRDYFSK